MHRRQRGRDRLHVPRRVRSLTSELPIGVFDSGVGGLTVLRALRAALPDERFLYLGDTARVPYGTKSPETVARYATNIADVLVHRGVKAIVIACNTASAFGIEAVRARVAVPVFDVIRPVAALVAARSPRGRIGVIGTRGTVRSRAYIEALATGPRPLHVVQRACPLFVPLVEEGWVRGEVPRRVVDTYLEDLFAKHDLDSLILGCTHYPLLRDEIDSAARRFAAGPIAIYDSGAPATAELVRALDGKGLRAAPRPSGGAVAYLVTDDPTGFADIGARFLGEPIVDAEHVTVGAA